jgi:hypothetical protein
MPSSPPRRQAPRAYDRQHLSRFGVRLEAWEAQGREPGEHPVTLGDGSDARTVTLDLSAAQVFVGCPPQASTLSQVNVGDHVAANLAVSYEVAKQDALSGTAVPVAALYDMGARPPHPSDGDGNHPAILGGRITALGQDQVTLALGDDDHGLHSVTLDLSAAQIFLGSKEASATAGTFSDLNVGDRAYAVLSVSAQDAYRDVQSGSPVPVARVYDAGSPPPTPPVLSGQITALGDNQVTVALGDGGYTVTFDLSNAQLYAGTHALTAVPESFSALQVGDGVYAVLSVSAQDAYADAQSGTPIPVSKLYDGGS